MTTTYIGTVKACKVELESPLTLPEGSQIYIILITQEN